jgi:hypothetical protein
MNAYFKFRIGPTGCNTNNRLKCNGKMKLKQTKGGVDPVMIHYCWFENTKIGQSPSQNYHYQNQILKS